VLFGADVPASSGPEDWLVEEDGLVEEDWLASEVMAQQAGGSFALFSPLPVPFVASGMFSQGWQRFWG
jgi:hypothetical protein